MVAVIILKGLFLLNCRQPAAITPPTKGTCQILVSATSVHRNTAGDKELPDKEKNFTVSLQGSKAKKRYFTPGVMTLASDVVINPQKAKHVIEVPIPDEVIGASMVGVLQNDALHGTSPAFIGTKPDGNGRYRIPEVVILKYNKVNNGGSFQLLSGGSVVVGSKKVGQTQVLVLTSTPRTCDEEHGDHTAEFNQMLSRGPEPAKFQLTGLKSSDACGYPDDPKVGQLNLPDDIKLICYINVAACPTGAAKKGADVHTHTVDHTGCGLMLAN